MSDALRLVALNAGFAVLGAAALVVLGVPARRSWLPTLAGLSLLTGLALCGLVASLGAMVGLDVGIATTVAVALAAVLAARWALAGCAPRLGSLRPRAQSAVGRVVELACLALLGLLAVRMFGLVAASGLGWDGWAVWATKSHALLVDGDVWGPVFAEPEYAMHHPEYPILLPSLETLSAQALGRFDANLIDLQGAAILASFGPAVWGLLRLVVPPAGAAAVGVGLTGSTPLMWNVSQNYADAVVAVFVAAGLLCLLLWLAHGALPTLVLAGLCLAAGGMTKAEGLVFALLGVASALLVARGFGRARAPVLGLAAGVAALPLLWSVVDRLNGPGPRIYELSSLLDPGYVAGVADRIPVATTRLLDEIGDAWALVSLAVVVGLAAAACARLWWPLLFVGIWAGLAFASLVASYVASTLPFDWHLGTSADRVVYSVVLGLAAVTPVLVSLAWERAVVAPRAPSGPTGMPEGRA